MNLEKTIHKALLKYGNLAPLELAGKIADFIEIAQELESDSPIRTKPLSVPEERKVLHTTLTDGRLAREEKKLIVMPGEDEPPPRMLQPKQIDVDAEMKEIERTLQSYAPPSLEIDLGDGKPPILLQRKITKKEADFCKMYQLSYSQAGEEEAPMVSFAPGDTVDLIRAIEEIRQSAKMRYSRQKRTVETRKAPAKSWSLDDVLARAPHADAGDERTELAAEWGKQNQAHKH